MKKFFSLLLALSMLLVCGASAEAVDLTGNWYADLFGMSMDLTLNADGTYTMVFMEEAEDGIWAQTETGISIDNGEVIMSYDAEANTLNMDMEGMAVIFTREAVAAFVPAEARTDATLEEYAGTWNATMVSVMGMTVSPEEMGIGMGAVIEGTTITMISTEGEESESEQFEAVFADGVLSIPSPVVEESTEEAVAAEESYTFTLLVDGTLLITAGSEELSMDIYMEPVAAEEMPAEEAPVEEVPAA